MADQFKVLIITRLTKGNSYDEEKILGLNKLKEKTIANIIFKCNENENIYIINSNRESNKKNKLISDLRNEKYLFLRKALLEEFTGPSKITSFFLFIHFGGDRIFEIRKACEKILNQNDSKFQFQVYAMSSQDKKEIGAFLISDIKKELEKDITGHSLVEKLNSFDKEFNLIHLENKIIESKMSHVSAMINNIEKIGVNSKISIPAFNDNQFYCYNESESHKGVPKFLVDYTVDKNNANAKINIRFLYISEILKTGDPADLNLNRILSGEKPCIFIGILDTDFNQNEIRKLLDPRFLFFDSSIWFRYLSIRDIGKIGELKNELEKYWDLGLYDLPASIEFYEFQKRLCKNSYIETFGTQPSHGGMITPFTFHSETLMKKLADNIVEQIYVDLKSIKSWSWNILFYDDDARETKGSVIEKVLNLQKVKENKDENGIIEKVYKSIIKSKDGNSLVTLNFHFILINDFEKGRKTITQTIEYNSQKKFFDVILLDYLFVLNEDQYILSDEFIVSLLSEDRNKNFGYFDKLWLFPVSVYQNALLDKLGNAGVSYYEGNAIFSEGADPISTPHLFRYKFYKFLELQLENLKSSRSRKSFKEIVDAGVSRADDGYVALRRWASNYYDDIVLLGGIFEKLCKYKSRSSFAESALKNLFHDLKEPEDWYQIRIIFYHLANSSKSQKSLVLESVFYFNKHEKKNPLFEILKKITVEYYK